MFCMGIIVQQQQPESCSLDSLLPCRAESIAIGHNRRRGARTSLFRGLGGILRSAWSNV